MAQLKGRPKELIARKWIGRWNFHCLRDFYFEIVRFARQPNGTERRTPVEQRRRQRPERWLKRERRNWNEFTLPPKDIPNRLISIRLFYLPFKIPSINYPMLSPRNLSFSNVSTLGLVYLSIDRGMKSFLFDSFDAIPVKRWISAYITGHVAQKPRMGGSREIELPAPTYAAVPRW